jgi:hypothetical protein
MSRYLEVMKTSILLSKATYEAWGRAMTLSCRSTWTAGDFVWPSNNDTKDI